MIDPETLQKLGGRFDTQKDLADFLGITPQTLSRELKLCRLIFRWKERNVQVVNQSLMRYEIFSPENELVGRVKIQSGTCPISWSISSSCFCGNDSLNSPKNSGPSHQTKI